jgi:hypothetical protein
MIRCSGQRVLVTDRLIREAALGRVHQALSAAGAYIRAVAQNSMAYRPLGISSAPGHPPFAHTKTGAFLRRRMRFAVEGNTVVIGPEALPGKAIAPRVLEGGGVAWVKNPRARLRKLGDGGEIRIGGCEGFTSKPSIDQRGRQVMVTYARLQTARQVRRANELNTLIYGPPLVKHLATIAPRPYMGPALAVAKAVMPEFWATSVVTK